MHRLMRFRNTYQRSTIWVATILTYSAMTYVLRVVLHA